MTDEITTTSPNALPTPVVFERGGQARANSRDVAGMFGKQHKNVLRDIEALIAAAPACALNFEPAWIEVAMPRGGARRERAFSMDRKGFMLLAMGFTGEAAVGLKSDYIDAFDAMEVRLRAAPAIDVRNHSQLALIATQLIEVNQGLESRVASLEPKAAGFDLISTADGSLNRTEAAKALQQRPGDLIGWLRRNRWTYRRAGSTVELGYQDKVQAGLLEHKVTTVDQPDGSKRIFEQVRITPKGLSKLAGYFGPAEGVA